MTIATLMVRLTAGDSNEQVLRFAADCATQLKATKVIGISARQPLQIYTSPDGYVPAELINWDIERIEKELKAAERSFHAGLAGKVAALEWRSTSILYGTTADYVAEQMRAADLLITPAEERAELFDSGRHVSLADLALKLGKPALVVGPAVDKFDLRSVVLCWKNTREARRAAEDALPILKLAGRITIVEVAAKDDLDQARAGTEDVAAWLASHGITASACPVGAADDDAAEINTIAKQLDAGLIVGGAYGHTRVREWVLGGVTRDLLLRPVRCSLISH